MSIRLMSCACCTMVSEIEEKYRYSRKSLSGAMVSVICTRLQRVQNASSSGYRSSSWPSCSGASNALASGIDPRDQNTSTSALPHERHENGSGFTTGCSAADAIEGDQ